MYAKSIIDQSISKFVSSEYLEWQIEEEFFNKIARLDRNDEYFDPRKNYLEIQEKKEIDTAFSMKELHEKSIKEIQ